MPNTFLEVGEVRQLAGDSRIRAHLDWPKEGERIVDRSLRVAGWALGRDAVLSVAAELRLGETVLERIPLGVERPDLEKAFPDEPLARTAGFRARLPLGAAVVMDLAVDAVLADGLRAKIAEVSLRQRFEDADDPAPAVLASVIVTGAENLDAVLASFESVLPQTYPNFEIVLVGSGSLGEEMQRAFGDPVIVLPAGSSIAEARNAGLRASSGSVVLFLSEGERLLPNALEASLRELSAQPACGMVCGRCTVTRPYHNDPAFPQQPFVGHDHYRVLLGRNILVSPSAAAFRRAAIEAVDGFDESLDILDDYDLYLRLAREFAVGTHTATIAESPAPDPLRASPQRSTDELALILRRQLNEVSGDEWLRQAVHDGARSWQDRYGTRIDLGQTGEGRHPIQRSRSEATGYEKPASGALKWGDLRRITPLSRNFGFDRGTPVDRYYIETFLEGNARDIRGRVLEVQENDYTRRFGTDRVESSDVLSLLPDNPKATIVGDLADPRTLGKGGFDCAIVTQVLHLVHDPRLAVGALHGLLNEDGVALVTLPGISQVEWSETWHWSFTVLSAHRIFTDMFGRGNVEVRSYGNVLAATSFLMGIACEELDRAELDALDVDYPVVVAIRGVKRPQQATPLPLQ